MTNHARSCVRRKLRPPSPRPFGASSCGREKNTTGQDFNHAGIPGAVKRRAAGKLQRSFDHGPSGYSQFVAVKIAKNKPYSNARSARAPPSLYGRDAQRAQARRRAPLRLRPRLRRLVQSLEKSFPLEVIIDVVVRVSSWSVPSSRAFPFGPRKVPLYFFDGNPFKIGARSRLHQGTVPRRFVVYKQAPFVRQKDGHSFKHDPVPEALRAYIECRGVS